MKVLIIGAGAWGTALAICAAQQHSADLSTTRQVTLWMRKPEQHKALAAERQNARYLPGVDLPAALALDSRPQQDLPLLCRQMDLVIVATPTASARIYLSLLQDCTAPVAWLCKGFERVEGPQEGLWQAPLVHEIAAAVAPKLRTGVLSGPSFAQEVARAQPTALVAASAHESVRQALLQAFHCAHLRVYASDDVVGVEVGGAVKNVLAIASGLCDGMALGLNARAALLTRGLAEMSRLGLALGAKSETFMGLSGLGDLILTATGDLSRNRQVGLLLAKGLSLPQALESLGHVAEGVYSAHSVLARAQSLGVDMPIAHSVVQLLQGQINAQEAVRALMGRQARSEH
jgi:glycerol-3-phosphate dehydrogenase (NAD(P)+)